MPQAALRRIKHLQLRSLNTVVDFRVMRKLHSVFLVGQPLRPSLGTQERFLLA